MNTSKSQIDGSTLTTYGATAARSLVDKKEVPDVSQNTGSINFINRTYEACIFHEVSLDEEVTTFREEMGKEGYTELEIKTLFDSSGGLMTIYDALERFRDEDTTRPIDERGYLLGLTNPGYGIYQGYAEIFQTRMWYEVYQELFDGDQSENTDQFMQNITDISNT